MIEKTIIAIGGGELKIKETIAIDEQIAKMIKTKAGDQRGKALFIPTASHDSMPYFNSFRKTYTSVFDIKVDVALSCYGEMSIEKIKDKIEWADMIYVGGGDTLFMLEKWKETGMDKMIFEAYEKGTIICGLSAGAICWFEKMYTDSKLLGEGYHTVNGTRLLKGYMCPHYNHRHIDFDKEIIDKKTSAYAVEDNCALKFIDGELKGIINGGGKAYFLDATKGKLIKNEMKV